MKRIYLAINYKTFLSIRLVDYDNSKWFYTYSQQCSQEYLGLCIWFHLITIQIRE